MYDGMEDQEHGVPFPVIPRHTRVAVSTKCPEKLPDGNSAREATPRYSTIMVRPLYTLSEIRDFYITNGMLTTVLK